jgi:hypothetical protein
LRTPKLFKICLLKKTKFKLSVEILQSRYEFQKQLHAKFLTAAVGVLIF